MTSPANNATETPASCKPVCTSGCDRYLLLQLKIFFPEVTVAKPKSSRNSSIGIGVVSSTVCNPASLHVEVFVVLTHAVNHLAKSLMNNVAATVCEVESAA